jgi:uracil-DNA glycosylase
MVDKKEELEQIAEEVRNLTASPLYEYRTQNNYHMVFGTGDPDADILFIGEAPGEWEAKKGEPFVGASGRMLNELLAGIGLARDKVYITNVVKDRPPENRDPSKAEIELYTPFLLRQIEVIQPKVIATLGRFAMDFIFATFDMPQQGEKISALHGKILTTQTPYGEIAVVPLFHPAVALYNQSQKQTLVDDFQVLKKIAGGR